MTSTIVIIGFPLDATMRERKNIAKYLPGFVTAHYLVKSGTVFAKFDSPESAQAAVDRLNHDIYDADDPGFGPLKASIAKRELEVRDEPQKKILAASASASYPSGLGSAPVALRPVSMGHMGGMREMAGMGMPLSALTGPRASSVPAAAGVDTVAVMKVGYQGLTPEGINETFGLLPGFIACQYNDRIDACFVKFNTAQAAQRACSRGMTMGIQAEMAKRSLTMPGEAKGSGKGGGYHDYAAQDSYAPAPKRMRTEASASAGAIDTLVVMKLAKHGLSLEAVSQTFQSMQGFVTVQYNEPLDAAFVKFTSPGEASAALRLAGQCGVPTEMARRSMNA
mmetsp:Transcript_53198/g.121060  ORF Transcript_53198/g.121060 Transcript_53198/m.121060 type:complete len:337 (-) Transcript_53198:48-1058(-)